jgi:hypothetical protein
VNTVVSLNPAAKSMKSYEASQAAATMFSA